MGGSKNAKKCANRNHKLPTSVNRRTKSVANTGREGLAYLEKENEFTPIVELIDSKKNSTEEKTTSEASDLGTLGNSSQNEIQRKKTE